MSGFITWAKDLVKRAQEYENKKKGRITVKAPRPELSEEDYAFLAELDRVFRD